MWERVVGSVAHRWLDLGLWLLVLLQRPYCQHSQLWTRHGKIHQTSWCHQDTGCSCQLLQEKVFGENQCIFFEIEIKTSLSHCVTKNDPNEQSVLVHIEEKLQNFFRVWHSERAIEVVGRRSDLVTRSWGGQWSIRGIASPAIDNSSGGREAHQALRIAWLVPSPLLLQCSLISSIYGTTHCGH